MPHLISTWMEPRLAQALARLRAEYADVPWALTYLDFHAARCADDALRLRQIRPGARVLNIGGAPYAFDLFARTLGMQVHAWDLDPARHQSMIAALGLSAEAVDIEAPSQAMLAELGTYDVICLCEVFEHMRMDLIGTMRRLQAAMKPGALLYLTTPNFYFAPRFLRMLMDRRSGPAPLGEWRKLSELGHMGHVREYARAELAELLEFSGFAIDAIIARNGQSVRGGGWGPSALARLLARHCDGFAQDFVFLLRKA